MIKNGAARGFRVKPGPTGAEESLYKLIDSSADIRIVTRLGSTVLAFLAGIKLTAVGFNLERETPLSELVVLADKKLSAYGFKFSSLVDLFPSDKSEHGSLDELLVAIFK